MSRSAALQNIIRQPDGTAIGVWGIHTLKSAFQPIFAFRGGRVEPVAYEGLMRAFRDGRPVAPKLFFAALPRDERSDVETLARTLHLVNAGRFLDSEALLFVNFDPSLLSDPAQADRALTEMRLVLRETAIPPQRMVCEVTEQKAHSERALGDFVQALRRHGFRIAVDDFGEADSDGARIASIHPDIVKFDARWITRLMESEAGFALLARMVEEFAARGVATVFEGIEERWQLDLAERSGVSMVQGFALARPQLAAAFPAREQTEASRHVPQDAAAAPAEAAERRKGDGRRGEDGRSFGRRR